MTQLDLIQRAHNGDGAAWEALVRQHQEAVFRLAYLHLGDPAEAEDVAQDVFIRALRSLARFDAERPLRPWLLRITANLAHNRRRADSRYRAALSRAARASPDPITAPAEREVARRREAERLRQAVQRLPTKDREVIYLRYFLELPVEETAQALNVAPGTVKSRLSRALSRLRVVVTHDFPELVEGFEAHEPTSDT